MNVQQTLGDLVQFNADDVKLPYESADENNKIFNLNEEHGDNDNDEDDNDEDENDKEKMKIDQKDE